MPYIIKNREKTREIDKILEQVERAAKESQEFRARLPKYPVVSINPQDFREVWGKSEHSTSIGEIKRALGKESYVIKIVEVKDGKATTKYLQGGKITDRPKFD